MRECTSSNKSSEGASKHFIFYRKGDKILLLTYTFYDTHIVKTLNIHATLRESKMWVMSCESEQNKTISYLSFSEFLDEIISQVRI